jgi:hypothetical protein
MGGYTRYGALLLLYFPCSHDVVYDYYVRNTNLYFHIPYCWELRRIGESYVGKKELL